MARFWISVDGEDLRRAMMLLDGASIPTIGSFPAYRGDQPPPDWQLDRLTTAVDAKTEQDAMASVRAILPDGYELSAEAPLRPRAQGRGGSRSTT